MTGGRVLCAAALAGALAGCGHASEPTHAPASRTARPTPLVYVWRNFEATGVPEEATVYANGLVRYRNLLHTQMGIKVLTTRLRPGQLLRVRRLLARADLAHADASNVEPRPDGYRWVLRHAGQVGTGADGHLHGPFRQLVRSLDRVMDRLQARSL